MPTSGIKLGVNIDHVATVRQARGTAYPDIVAAARAAEAGGADLITVHLREDRRHIQDADVVALKAAIATHLNLELAATRAMVDFACSLRPRACCIVPERREELTTEGGLDVVRRRSELAPICRELDAAGIEVSLFIDPDPAQIDGAVELGVPTIELHTGRYADASGGAVAHELAALEAGVKQGAAAGLRVNAGHGLHYDNVAAVAALAPVDELNIGHALVARALFCGLETAVREMRHLLDGVRG